MGADPDLTPVGLARMSGCAEHQAGRNCPVHGVRKMADRWWIHVCPECNGLVGEYGALPDDCEVTYASLTSETESWHP